MTRTLLLAALALLVSGCSLLTPGDPTYSEGARLDVTDHGQPLPASREGYARFATFNTPGAVQIVDPGAGPDDPPRLLRTIRFREHIVNEQQIDREGYLWVATPDAALGGALRVFYAVDPHTGRVHRAIRVPEEFRAVAGLTVGPDRVYIRSWRNGFSGGIASVSRQCTADARQCTVEPFAELGNVGLTLDGRSLHLEGDDLYSFSGANSRDNRFQTARFNVRTGAEIASLALSGSSGADEGHFYFGGYYPGVAEPVIIRVDKQTLTEEARAPALGEVFQVASDGERVYVADDVRQVIRVFDSETLDLIRTIQIPIQTRVTPSFGFLAPGVLQISFNSWFNTQANSFELYSFPLQESFSKMIRFPEGHPRAF